MKKTAEIISMPTRAPRSGKVQKPKRLNTLEVIRKDVLGITQREVREILGFLTDRSVYDIEKSDTDRLTIDNLRALRSFARENDIPWSANLVEKLLDHDPTSGESPIKRRRGKAEEG